MSGPLGSQQWMYASGGYQIEDSLRFNDNDSAYLSRTPASASNRKTWTFSCWLKRENDNTAASVFFGGGATSSARTLLYFSSNSLRLNHQDSGSTTVDLITEALFRDVSAFYNVVFSVDTTQATASDRVKLYVNGEQITSFSTSTYPALDKEFDVNEPSPFSMSVGATPYNTAHFSGYISDVYFIDGQALDASSFGETVDGYWRPVKYSGSYGTNGFHLKFDGAVTDSSGNGNDWTANNISAHDYVPDSPTNNFAVISPLITRWSLDGNTLSEGNLKVSSGNTTNFQFSTFDVRGKYYFEMYVSALPAIATIGVQEAVRQHSTGDMFLRYASSGAYAIGATSGTTTTYGVGDVVAIAYDTETGDCEFFKNGTSIVSGTADLSAYNSFIAGGSLRLNAAAIWNFGQDSTFAGNTTAGGNTDANGIGDFKYAPPSGYLALCTANLPEPTIIDGSEHFNTVLYNGNNNTGSQSVTGVGFQPDFLWLKERTSTNQHYLVDSVRGDNSGVMRSLYSSLTIAEEDTNNQYVTEYGIISSLDSDGFTVGSGSTSSGATNFVGRTYVAWNWLAGGTAVSNTAGSITSQVSANINAGFSIVSYTGTGSVATVGHGLSSAPDVVIHKNRTAGSTDWELITTAIDGSVDYIRFTTAAAGNSSRTAATSTVFEVGGGSNQGASGNDYIAYCFHSVEGFSKVGSYTGNGSADGTFVYTGFRPAWVMIKRTNNTGSWYMYDKQRDEYNVVEQVLQANDDVSEITSANNPLDFLSNGFKLRGSGGSSNGSGDTYIFFAFAENTFKYANAR
jgi:hypothetical protein